ncbi:MAG: PASTA domain-containing protein [Flavobacteriales bacterium]|nr:PASTA domain-containing protein [Flavobacteriales bacterium]
MNKTLKTLLLIGLATIGFIALSLIFIHFYTGHGKALVKVPKIEGLKIDKAVEILVDQGFNYEITDTVYRDGKPLLSIIDQDPEADFDVKYGRKIYLVLNSDKIPDVIMPDVTDGDSYDQVVRSFKSIGLKIGKITEQPIPEIKDPDSKTVLGVFYPGTQDPIKPGTKIQRNSTVDMAIGVMIRAAAADTTSTEGE